MPTEQGAMLIRISAAFRQVAELQARVDEAKEELKRTREAIELENAKAELKAAQKVLGYALEETAQLPLPALAMQGTERVAKLVRDFAEEFGPIDVKYATPADDGHRDASRVVAA